MQLHLESRRKKQQTLIARYPDAAIIDVTSKGDLPWLKFSPFFPHGGIPIPFSENRFGQSVEGIWQGLKVFENEGIDPKKFEITTMKGLKRTVRKHGPVRGHQKGTDHPDLLDYIEARKRIYLPIYQWVLKNKLEEECRALIELAQQGPLVLLDYETNPDIENPKKPLSHAALIIRHLKSLPPK